MISNRRSDTMREARWRVQVWRWDSRLSCSSVYREETFPSAEAARMAYAGIIIPGEMKSLQVRRAGTARFLSIEEEIMRTP
jgi:hypothetical protein